MKRIMVIALLVLSSCMCAFYVTAKIRPVPDKYAKAHSVIYLERTIQNGQETDRIKLRTVSSTGTWKLETLWPDSTGRVLEVSNEGVSTSTDGGPKVIASRSPTADTENLLKLSAEEKQKASEVRNIAGLKAYVFKGDPSLEVVLDRAFADETGITPLWTHAYFKKTGREVISEALRVIWGTQDKEG